MNTTKTILVCAAVAAAAAGAATDIDEIGAVPSAETSRSSVTQADLESSPLARLAKAIEDGDATFVAKLVHYPLERTAPLPSIPNEEEFVKRFPVLFDETFRERIRRGIGITAFIFHRLPPCAPCGLCAWRGGARFAPLSSRG